MEGVSSSSWERGVSSAAVVVIPSLAVRNVTISIRFYFIFFFCWGGGGLSEALTIITILGHFSCNMSLNLLSLIIFLKC